MFENAEHMRHRNYTEGVLENGELLMQFAMSHEVEIANTMYKTHIGKLATYRIVEDSTEVTYEQIDNKTHAQIDFVIVSHRWRNSTTDVESDTRANLDTDHFPPHFEIRVRLKQISKRWTIKTNIYKQCDSTQQDDLNYEIWNTIPTEQNNNDRYKVIKDRLKQGVPTLPKAHPKDGNKRYEPSNTSENTKPKENKTAKNINLSLFLTLNTQFTKSRKKTNKRILESVSTDVDLRGRRLGIRELKRKYDPTPFHNKNAEGIHIQHKQGAQEAVTHLSEKQWGTNTGNEEQIIIETPIIDRNTEQYNIDYPTLIEIQRAIRKLRRRKAPGPDDIPTQLLNKLKEDNIREVRKLFKQWWEHENVDTEELKARVVLIYKKETQTNSTTTDQYFY